MVLPFLSGTHRLDAAKRIIKYLSNSLDTRFSVRLWDGSMIPLGKNADSGFFISIQNPGALGSVLRWPTLENALRQYASGGIDFEGGDLIDFIAVARETQAGRRLKGLSKLRLLLMAIPLFLTPQRKIEVEHQYGDDETGQIQSRRKNRDFIQFHYDLGNDFYRLFLDPEMQYSCAYYRDWGNSLEHAQTDKMEMICRKLRLAPGDRLLDIGCGWGGLVTYAAKNYGVKAHGVTLSQAQFDYATEKVRGLGLEDSVTVELRDYMTLEGTYDKIASIGMYEHVGITNYPAYFKKIRSLLREWGILLNHGICRRAKRTTKKFNIINPEKRLILKYIFPGSELDHVGHTIESMEASGFEVHDAECWREHYAATTRHWGRRLAEHRDEAIAQVGRERYRMWIAYLAGVSLGFTDGNLLLYQVVATKRGKRGPSGIPPTREDLYRSGD
jgi:cyclopropane-fatty-acyl-phospholipid synthase